VRILYVAANFYRLEFYRTVLKESVLMYRLCFHWLYQFIL